MDLNFEGFSSSALTSMEPQFSEEGGSGDPGTAGMDPCNWLSQGASLLHSLLPGVVSSQHLIPRAVSWLREELDVGKV